MGTNFWEGIIIHHVMQYRIMVKFRESALEDYIQLSVMLKYNYRNYFYDMYIVYREQFENNR